MTWPFDLRLPASPDLMLEGMPHSWAVFSTCRLYRYLLVRRWSTIGDRLLLWILTNPSTAGAMMDDNTVTVCKEFSTRAGFDGMVFANLKAFIATDPSDLRRACGQGLDVVGQHNLACVDWGLLHAKGNVVVAWGAAGEVLGRDRAMLRKLASQGFDPKCLGITAKGFPRHPLRLSYETQLVHYGEPQVL